MAKGIKGRGAAAARTKGATRKGRGKVTLARPSFAWLNRLLILAGAGVVLAAGLQAFIYLYQIPVTRIAVTGKLENTRTGEVQDMVAPALVGGFLNADLQQIRAELEALPWIHEVQVRRRWPSALEIHVVEQLAIARWGARGYLNHEGEVFQTEGGRPLDSLPLLQGPEGSEAQLVHSYQRLAELLVPLGREVRSLQAGPRGQLKAVLAGDLELVLGDENFNERVRRFVALYQAELVARAGDLERVDLRYRSGLAVAYREPSQVAGL